MDAPTEQALHRKLVWITFFRLVTVTVLLGGTALVNWRSTDESSAVTTPLYAVVAATYAAALASAWLLRQRLWLVPLAWAQLAVDVGTAAVVVAVTGRVESVFVFMFLLAIVDGAILLDRRGAVVALGLALLVYLPIATLAVHPVPWRPLWAHAGAFAATAVLAAYLAEQLRRAGERLAEREGDLAAITALHESIVQSVTSGLLTLDVAGRVTFLNRAGEAMTGVARGEVVGRPARVRFAAFRTDTARGETDFEAAGGTRLRLGYSAFPLQGRGGVRLGTAVIFQDLTGLRAMEDRVALAERLADLGRLSAGLAHELRNPLASMMGAVELLHGSASLAAEDQRLLGIVLREGGRLAQLVTDFLAFARPAPLRRAAIDLAELAGQALDAFAHDPAAEAVALERDLRPTPIRCDAGQLQQVLWNLLVNAAQALGPPTPGARRGVIRVACRPLPDGGAELAVEDDGPGISPEDRERIFTPFFTTRPDGTGLGLATVHQLVTAHGGAVSAEAAAPRGARLVVRLPPAAAEPE